MFRYNFTSSTGSLRDITIVTVNIIVSYACLIYCSSFALLQWSSEAFLTHKLLIRFHCFASRPRVCVCVVCVCVCKVSRLYFPRNSKSWEVLGKCSGRSIRAGLIDILLVLSVIGATIVLIQLVPEQSRCTLVY